MRAIKLVVAYVVAPFLIGVALGAILIMLFPPARPVCSWIARTSTSALIRLVRQPPRPKARKSR